MTTSTTLESLSIDLDADGREKRLQDAFAASVGKTADEIWKSASTRPTQHDLSAMVYKFQADEYEASLTGMRSKIRFQCARAPKAGLWITAMPTNAALTMSDAQYKYATLYRIGGRIFTDEFRGELLQVHKDAGPVRRARDHVRQLQQRDETTT